MDKKIGLPWRDSPTWLGICLERGCYWGLADFTALITASLDVVLFTILLVGFPVVVGVFVSLTRFRALVTRIVLGLQLVVLFALGCFSSPVAAPIVESS